MPARKSERCPVCHRVKKRGNKLNARYWLLLHLIADGIKPEGKQYSAESFHNYFKLRFLGADEIRLPNGKTINMPKSSAELDHDEFAMYMMRVEQWAQERNIYMEELDETT